MGFFSKLKKSTKSVAKQNVFEAAVAIGVLVASVGGEFSKKEKEKLERILNAGDSFSSFSKSEKTRVINQYSAKIEADFRMGQRELLKEIEDVAENNDDAEEVFITGISIAEADGGIDKDELAMLVKIGKLLGQNLKDYGIDDVSAA